MGQHYDLVLASASPRRKALLSQLGLQSYIYPADIDECLLSGESAESMVSRLAREKALHVQGRLRESTQYNHLPILGSDTIGLCNGEVLVKPQDFDDYARMMTMMSGASHQVLTAVSVCMDENTFQALNTTTVWFREISAQDMRAYWDSGEPQGKAGGYAIQGLAAQFVIKLAGSYSGVMGLPLYESAELLKQAGVSRLTTFKKSKEV